jgi:hypothetical protein
MPTFDQSTVSSAAPEEVWKLPGSRPEQTWARIGHSGPHTGVSSRARPHSAECGKIPGEPGCPSSGMVFASGGRCWVRTNVG